MKSATKELCERATKLHAERNYVGVADCLEELLSEKLSPEDELLVLDLIGPAFCQLKAHDSAIACGARKVELLKAQENGSPLHGRAILNLATILYNAGGHMQRAVRCAKDALAIFQATNCPIDCARAYLWAGVILNSNGQYKDALLTFAKALAIKEMENDQYVHCRLLDACATSYKGLCDWKEAFPMQVAACARSTLLDPQLYGTECALIRFHLGELAYTYKEMECALDSFTKSWQLCLEHFGPNDARTINAAFHINKARDAVAAKRRDLLPSEHDFRICLVCVAISTEVGVCNGCTRAFYCSEKCQIQDWPNHRKDCNACAYCQTGLNITKLRSCSRCGVTKYCDAECQTAHWRAEHKNVCKK
jgi:tetratricopeptide (TPR) repeat protein